VPDEVGFGGGQREQPQADRLWRQPGERRTVNETDDPWGVLVPLLPRILATAAASFAVQAAVVRWVLRRQGVAVTWRQTLLANLAGVLGIALVRTVADPVRLVTVALDFGVVSSRGGGGERVDFCRRETWA
jgi:hypothetical protein